MSGANIGEGRRLPRLGAVIVLVLGLLQAQLAFAPTAGAAELALSGQSGPRVFNPDRFDRPSFFATTPGAETGTAVVTITKDDETVATIEQEWSNNNVYVTWDARIDGDAAPDGDYDASVALTAANGDTNGFDVSFRLDRRPVVTLISPVEDAEITDTITGQLQVNDGFTLDGPVRWMYYPGSGGGASVTMGTTTPDDAGLHSITTAVPATARAGSWFVQASFNWTDALGAEHFDSESVFVEFVSDIGGVVKTKGATFSPNGDGQDDTAAFTFTTASEATAMVTVSRDGAVVATPLAATTLPAGEHTYTWDGKAEDADQPDGQYLWKLTLERPGSRTQSAEEILLLDRRTPGTVATPADGDTISGTATFRFEPNPTFSSWQTDKVEFLNGDDVLATATSDWSTEPVSYTASVDTLTIEDPDVALRARVTYSLSGAAGKLTWLSPVANVTVANPSDLSGVTEHVYFTPNGDGQDDIGTASYYLSAAAKVTVTVTRVGESTPLLTLVDDEPRPRYTNEYTWDGKVGGTYVADGDYKATISVAQPSGAPKTGTTFFHVDTFKPSAAITSPASGATIAGTAAPVEITVPAGMTTTNAYIEVVTGSLGGEYYRSGPPVGGKYSFALDTTYAEDGANGLVGVITYIDGFGRSRTWRTPTIPVTVDNPLRVDGWWSPRYIVPADPEPSEATMTTTWYPSHAMKVTATVFDDSVDPPAVARVLLDEVTVTEESVDVVWDGRGPGGAYVAAGEYRVHLTFEDASGGAAGTKTEKDLVVGVHRGVPVRLVFPTDGSVLNGLVELEAAAGDGVTLQSLSFNRVGAWWSKYLSAPTAGRWVAEVESNDIGQGAVTLKAMGSWQDPLGGYHSSSTPTVAVTVTNDAGVRRIYDDMSTGGYFNPTHSQPPGGQTSTYSRFFELSEDADWTASIAGASGVVATTAPARGFRNSTQTFRWDGRNGSGDIVPPGDYTVTLAVTDDESGAVTTADFSVFVDTSPPGAITSPAPGALLDGTSPVIFTPADGKTIKDISLYGRNGNETRLLAWGFANSSEPIEIEPDLSGLPAGVSQLYVQASWQRGDRTHYTHSDPVSFSVDSTGTVTMTSTDRAFFPDFPDGDGVEDTTEVEFALGSQGTVTVEVLKDDAVIATLLEPTVKGYGTHTETWDGRDGDREPVAAGEYVVRVTSTGSNGTSSTAEVKRFVDLRSVGAVAAPAPAAVVGNVVPVVFDPGTVPLTSVQFCIAPSFSATCQNAVLDPTSGLYQATLTLPPGSGGSYNVTTLVRFDDVYGKRHDWRPADIPVTVDASSLNVTAFYSPVSGVAPLSTKLVLDASAPSGRTLHYTIDFGDGGDPVEGDIAPPYDAVQIPRTFPGAKTYTGSVTVTDNDGRTVVRALSIRPTLPPNHLPVPNAAVAPGLVLRQPAAGAPVTISLTFQPTDDDDGNQQIDWIVGWGDADSAEPCAPMPGCTGGGLGTFTEGGEAVTLSHTFAEPGRYPVQVVVGDGQGSGKQLFWVDVKKYDPPHADFGDEDHFATYVGDPLFFDGSASTPEDPDSITWDFDDGSPVDPNRVTSHVYDAPGTYFPTLSVKVGEQTDVAEMTVTVFPRPPADSGLKVNVTGDGAPLNGARVVFTDRDGKTQNVRTVNGLAILRDLPDGDHAIQVGMPKYLPRKETATVKEGKGTVDIALASGDVVDVQLTAKPMTYEEIVKAGVDPNDPKNRNIIRFETRFAVKVTPEGDPVPVEASGMVNNDGFVGRSGGPSDDECTYLLTCDLELGNGYKAVPNVAGAGTKEPRIVWMIVPVEGSFLKEFFNVTMVIQNLGETGTFTDGNAKLNLPSGLSLPDLFKADQPLEQKVEDIPAGQTRSVSWVVRGDEQGDYTFDAVYTATHAPFGDELPPTHGKLLKPIKVFGNSALRYIVEFEPNPVKDQPMRFRVGIENLTPVPVYNVELDLKKGDGWVFAPTAPSTLRKTDKVLPGEENIWWAEWDIVPLESGEIQLDQSVLRRIYGVDGEQGPPDPAKQDILRPLGEDPDLPPGEKPTMTATDLGNGMVRLEWSAVKDATSYQVHGTTDLSQGMGEVMASTGELTVDVPALLPPDENMLKVATRLGEPRLRAAAAGGQASSFGTVANIAGRLRAVHPIATTLAKGVCQDGTKPAPATTPPVVGEWVVGPCLHRLPGTAPKFETLKSIVLNGLQIDPQNGAKIHLDAEKGILSATGPVAINLRSGATVIPLYEGELDLNLKKPDVPITVTGGNLLGLPLTGAATLNPTAKDAMTIDVGVEVAPVLGGQTAKAKLVIGPDGLKLDSLEFKADKASLGTLVGLEKLDLTYDQAQQRWGVEAAQKPADGGGSLKGWFQQDENGKATAGHLEIGNATVVQLLKLTKLSLDYGEGAWAGAVDLKMADGSAVKGSVNLPYDDKGDLTGDASFEAARVAVKGLFELTDFKLGFTKSEQGESWSGQGTLKGGTADDPASTVKAGLVVEDGAVKTADINAPQLPIGGLITFKPLKLHYGAAAAGGEPTWSGDSKVFFASNTGDTPDATLDVEIADGELESATGSLAKVDLLGVVRIDDGQVAYDSAGGWHVKADTAHIGQLFTVSNLDVKRDGEGRTWTVAGDLNAAGSTVSLASSKFVFDEAGKLTEGTLDMPKVAILGLVPLDDVKVTWAEEAWLASAGIGDGGHMSFSSKGGKLTGVDILIKEAKLGGVVDVKDFTVLMEDGAWSGGADASISTPDGKDAQLKLVFTSKEGAIETVKLGGSLGILGGIRIDDLEVAYTKSRDEWTGKAKVVLPGATTTVDGGLTFRAGKFVSGEAKASGVKVPIGTGIWLTDAGIKATVDGTLSLEGTVGIGAGPEIAGKFALSGNGKLTYTFGAESTPGSWKVEGEVKLVGFPVAGGYALFDPKTQRYEFQGTLGVHLKPLFDVSAEAKGLITPSDLSASGKASAAMFDGKLAIEGGVIANKQALSVCGRVKGADLTAEIGGRLPWGGVPGPGGCDLAEPVAVGGSTPQAKAVSAAGRAVNSGSFFKAVEGRTVLAFAADADEQTIEIAAGLPVTMFSFVGVTGAPRLTLVGPAGESITTPDPAGYGVQDDPRFIVVADDQASTTHVFVSRPSAGTWTATPAPGHSFASTTVANGLPAPQVSAEVSGDGGTKTLTWSLTPRAGQVVKFYDGGGNLLGETTEATGTLQFPFAGPGVPTVQALVEQDGFARREVALLSAELPASGSLSVQRIGTGLGSVISEPAGIACGAVCVAQLPKGATVTLTATAAPGNRFDGWGGACAGTSATCTIPVAALNSVTATFTAVPGGDGGDAGNDGGNPPGTVAAGGRVTSDPTLLRPARLDLMTPSGGTVSIVERPSSGSMDGMTLLPTEFDVHAPAESVRRPIEIDVTVEDSLLGGLPLVVLRDGTPATRCTGAGATPDPCVVSVGNRAGLTTVRIRTSHASRWQLAVPAAGSTTVACRTAGAGFADVPATNVHRSAIDCLRAYGVTQGVTADRYVPFAGVTRGQMASFLVRLLQRSGVELPVSPAMPFADVRAGDAHATSIAQLAAVGVARGRTATSFDPAASVTRAQMATFIVRAYELAAGRAAPTDGGPSFRDVGGAHAAAIERAASLGVTTGVSDGVFAPGAPVRRDQMASFLARTLNVLVAEAIAPAA